MFYGGASWRAHVVAIVALLSTSCGGRNDGGESSATGGSSSLSNHPSIAGLGAGGTSGAVMVTAPPTPDAALGPASVCTRTGDCKQTCLATNAACLTTANGDAPTQDVNFAAEVKSVTLQPWLSSRGCFAQLGSFHNDPTEQLLLELNDANGNAWLLSLPPDLVPADRFLPSSSLTVNFHRSFASGGLEPQEQRFLTVAANDQVELFFVDAQRPSAIPGTDLTFSSGEITCPYAIPSFTGCSSAQFAAVVSNGATEQSAPCRDVIGNFVVTALVEVTATAPNSCNPVKGVCDFNGGSFVASGARTRQ